jgi:heme-degrading monooxygenase HmoA
MFVALWEFDVKPGCEERFEKAYGPSGKWAHLFQSDPDFQETRLLRDPSRPDVYLTLDFWTSRLAYERFMVERMDEYKAIDAAASEELTVSERRVGWYELVEL